MWGITYNIHTKKEGNPIAFVIIIIEHLTALYQSFSGDKKGVPNEWQRIQLLILDVDTKKTKKIKKMTSEYPGLPNYLLTPSDFICNAGLTVTGSGFNTSIVRALTRLWPVLVGVRLYYS